MSKQNPLRVVAYLEHILESIDKIFRYVNDVSEVIFLQDSFVQDAILRNIEIIGEASKNITRYYPGFAKNYPEVSWIAMYAMRNQVSHGYFSVDLEIVWQVIEKDLPVLYEQISEIYKNLPQAYHE